MDYKITKRLKRVFSIAESYVKENDVLYPIHIFIALFEEKTGVLGELYLKCPIELNILCEIANDLSTSVCSRYRHDFFNIDISIELLNVIDESIDLMTKYKQNYLNEGHITSCLLALDNEVSNYLSNDKKAIILDITASARDLIVNLNEYTNNIEIIKEITIRRANIKDINKLSEFIISEFNTEWSNNVMKAFHNNPITLFLAMCNEEVIGFAAYNVVKSKKGLFGPMGVKYDRHNRGVGRALLFTSLYDMKKQGYAYAIISEAGPIEFYENSCNAVLIANE